MMFLILSLCILSPVLAQVPGNCSNIPDIPTAFPNGYTEIGLDRLYALAMFSFKPDNDSAALKCFIFSMELNDTLKENQNYPLNFTTVKKDGTKKDDKSFFKFYPDNSTTFVSTDKDGNYIEPFVAGRTILKKDLNADDPNKAKTYFLDLVWSRKKDGSDNDCILSWIVWSKTAQFTDDQYKNALEEIKKFKLPVDDDKIWRSAPDC